MNCGKVTIFPFGFRSVVDELEASSGEASSGHVPMLAREVDSKTLEKLTERSYYKDYQRLGLGSLTINATATTTAAGLRAKSEFRVTSSNSNYQLCRR